MIDDLETLLWEWVAEAEDPDPEQRAWKVAWIDGMRRATAVLGRTLPAPAAEPRGDRAAAEAHLAALLEEVRPMSRDPRPETLRGSWAFGGALEALSAAGLADVREWRERALPREMPWLDDEQRGELLSIEGEGVYAVRVPPETPEQEAQDAAAEAAWEARSRSGELRRVAVCREPARHDGLAITAVVARTETAEVHFHLTGPPVGGNAFHRAFQEATEALTPPALSDGAGTTYAPVSEGPPSAAGGGGPAHDDRPLVVTGMWRYTPAPPPDARAFAAELGGVRWELR